MEQKKFTFRQKWFPSIDDAGALRDERKGVSNSIDFPVIDFFGRWARSIVLAGAVLWGVYQGIGNNIEYATGEKIGMINKIGDKGLFWKTYEGQMALEGVVSGDNAIGANVWNFSLDRQARHGENTQELLRKIREYSRSSTKVILSYKQPFTTWPWRSETDYLIQDVEPTNKK